MEHMEYRSTQDRRRHPRLSAEVDVQLQPIDPLDNEPASTKTNHYAISRDVSESGMRIWANRSYPVNARLLLTFECRQMGWNTITSRVGLVVWAETLRHEGQYLLGIQFGEAD